MSGPSLGLSPPPPEPRGESGPAGLGKALLIVVLVLLAAAVLFFGLCALLLRGL